MPADVPPLSEASQERSSALGLSLAEASFHPRDMAEFFGPMDRLELDCKQALISCGAPERSCAAALSHRPFYLFEAGGFELLALSPEPGFSARGRSVWIRANEVFMGPREACSHYQALGQGVEFIGALNALARLQPGALAAAREAEALEREAPAASARAPRPGL